jgi:hypothetical protein
MRCIVLIILFLSLSVNAQDYFGLAEKARMDKDWPIAIKNYELAFEAGNPYAAHWLGTFYMDGVGVKKSSVHAAVFFLVAANEGVVGSMVYLANMRLTGSGIAQDCKKAEEWVLKFSKEPAPEAWKNKIAKCKNTFNKSNHSDLVKQSLFLQKAQKNRQLSQTGV